MWCGDRKWAVEHRLLEQIQRAGDSADKGKECHWEELCCWVAVDQTHQGLAQSLRWSLRKYRASATALKCSKEDLI